MRLLFADAQEGEVNDGTTVGEVVYPSNVHDIVQLGVLCPECRCSVSFTGLRSDRMTTVARCADMTVSPGELFELVVEHLSRVEDRPPAELFEAGLDVYGRVLLAGCNFNPGDRAYRVGPRLTARERPERGLGVVGSRP